MRKQLPIMSLLLAATFTSCQKMGVLKSHNTGLTSELVVPKGFNWESSRNIKVKVSVTDQSTGNSPFLIALYDHDPRLGGKAIGKGSASLKMAFQTSVYLSNQISTLYIVKTASNNAQVISKITPGNDNVEVSMEAPVIRPSTQTKKPHHIRKS